LFNTTVRTFTPEEAKAILAHQNSGNRPLSGYTVDRYAQLMREAKWKAPTNDSIVFSDGGRLINGQHRLAAVIKSGIPLTEVCVYGIKQDTFSVMDQQKRRNRGDALAISGLAKSNVATLAAAAASLWAIRTGKVVHRWDTLSHDDILDLVRSMPNQFHDVVHQYAGCRQLGIPASLLIALRWHCGEAGGDHDLADKFFQSLVTGADLSMESPIWRVRDRLLRLKVSRATMEKWMAAALVIKAWNLWISGRPFKRLAWDPGEGFPKVETIRSGRRG